MKTIVIPTDFSDYATHALDLGIELARLTGAHLDVVHAVPAVDDWWEFTEQDGMETSESDRLITDAKARLDELLNDLSLPHDQISTHLYNEAIHQAILDHVTRNQADVLIMGTHGRAGFSRFFLGSTTQKVMRLVDCPVVTLKGQVSVDDFRKILFVSDFEEDVSEVFQKVKNLVDGIGGTIDLLTIRTPLVEADKPVMTEHFQKIDQADYQTSHIKQIHSYNTVEDGVISFAQDGSYDAIAMGTHARKGVMRLLNWGSIAENLANKATLPVISVRM